MKGDNKQFIESVLTLEAGDKFIMGSSSGSTDKEIAFYSDKDSLIMVEVNNKHVKQYFEYSENIGEYDGYHRIKDNIEIILKPCEDTEDFLNRVKTAKICKKDKIIFGELEGIKGRQ